MVMDRRAPGPQLHSASARRFASIFATHYEAVLAYAMRRVQPNSAEDVVAETFLTAWRRLEHIPADALPWLLGIARRVLANAGRAARRQEALAVRLARQRPGPGRDPAEILTDGSAIRASLTRMSDKDREILMLVAWDGLDARRAGLVLGCSANAAAIRLHRARRRLAQALQEQLVPVPVPVLPREDTALEENT